MPSIDLRAKIVIGNSCVVRDKIERRVFNKLGVYPLFFRSVLRKPLTVISKYQIRCQERSFSEIQGFSGKSIEKFPPCGFYKNSLENPLKAYDKFYGWLRYCLIDMNAWKVPRCEGGWANGTLVTIIRELHLENGIKFQNIAIAEPSLINEGIAIKAKYYMDLFEKIQKKGFQQSLYPPIYCKVRDGLYYLENGYHRAAALWVLGYPEISVEIVK